MNLPLQPALDLAIALALALAAMPLLARQSAAVRHCVLATALAAGCLLPLIKPLMPAWPMAVAPPAVLELVSSAAMATRRPVDAAGRASLPSVATLSPGESWTEVWMVVWAAGVLVALAALGLAFFRLSRLERRARVVDDPRWRAHLERVQAQLRIARRVALLESPEPGFLVVWGILRPRVLLPPCAREWSDERVLLVLTHELAHVQRGDWIVQCAAELARALHWFNPLVWVACARLRQESDRACDDVVLSSGVDGSDYASHLVDIARLLRRQRAWLPAPAVAHATGFERRVRAMIDIHVNRRPLSRRAFVLTLALSLLAAAPIAGLTAAQVLVRFTGSVLDPTNAVLPGAVITLTNMDTQAKYEVRTDAEGRYEIPGLPSGRYLLESKLPGFQEVKLELTVGNENVHRDLKLEIGTLEESITVVNGAAGPPRVMTPEQRARLDAMIRKRASERCPDGPRVGPPVGGNLRVPIKIRDRRPIYPPDLAAAGIGGKVELDTVIGSDGRIDRVTVRSATHQAFADAAIDAVRQWEFDATLLNCVPVETPMKVTASFVSR